jgi:hypothetical protein
MSDDRTLIWELSHWQKRRLPDIQKELAELLALKPEFATGKKPFPGIPYVPYDWADVKHDEDRKHTSEPHRYIETEHGRVYLYNFRDGGLTRYEGSYRYFPLLVPRTKQGWKMQIPQEGYLEYDVMSGVTTVYDEEDNELADLQLETAMDTRSPDTLADMAKEQLALKGIPIWPAQMYAVNTEHFPWPIKKRHLGYAYISNDEVRVPLVGVVADLETEEYIYVHMVGHESNVRSILATFNTSRRKHIRTNTSLGGLSTYSSHNYRTYHRPVGDRLMSTILVDNRCLEQQVNDYGYLLRRRDEAGIDPGEAFAARLNSVLTVPVLREWGDILLKEGTNRKIARQIHAAGDVPVAYAVTRSERWQKLIQSLLDEGKISVPSPKEVS